MDPEKPNEILGPHDEENDLSIGYGTHLDRLDEPLILYPLIRDGIDALHDRLLKFVLPMWLLQFVSTLAITLLLANSPLVPKSMFLTQSTELWCILILSTLLLPINYLSIRRTLSRAVLPVMAMRKDGIEIHSLSLDIFIPWEEVKEVRTSTFIEPHLAIVPFDLKKTLARASLYTRIFCWASELSVHFYKIMQIPVTPISLLDAELPLPIDVVAEQIILRQAHALKLIKPED
ncbi:MAG: hypothetical protein WCT03_19730, partial [Candidatus Obscuribacterales bacterium]